MGSYNGGQSQGFTQRQGPPQYPQGGGWGAGGPQGGGGANYGSSSQWGLGAVAPDKFGSYGSPGVGNQPTQYPMQPMGPNSTNTVTFDDTQRYQQGGGPLTGTGAAYDPTYRPNGEMRQSFADPSGYAAQGAARQNDLAALLASRQRGPSFGPPPPMIPGGGDPYMPGGMGNTNGFAPGGMPPGVTHGDPATVSSGWGAGGLLGNPVRGRMPILPTTRNRNGY